MKIKLFSAKENKNIEGENAELYCNLYIVFNKTYFFTFLIESPNLACSDRNLIKLIKHWVMLVEEDVVKYLRRYERMSGAKMKRGERMTREEHIIYAKNLRIGLALTKCFSAEAMESLSAAIQALEQKQKQKTGHWIIIDDCEKFIAKCSVCGQVEDSRMIHKYPYCHCGAKMIESEE